MMETLLSVYDDYQMGSLDYFLIGFFSLYYAFFIWGGFYLRRRNKKQNEKENDSASNRTFPIEIISNLGKITAIENSEVSDLLDDANDERIYIDNRHFSIIGFTFGLIMSICGILLIITGEGVDSLLAVKMAASVPTSWCLVLLFMSISNPTEIFVFDRKEGTLTYPNGFFRKRTIPFREASVVHGRLASGAEYIGITHSNGVTWSNITFNYDVDSSALWSLFVWYMDKNRPLPPSSVFDPYREEDYERRKAEGFPLPLYKADPRLKIPSHKENLKMTSK